MQFNTQKSSLPISQLLLVFMAISAVGIGVGYFLVPTDSDNAYILLKDNYVSNAIEKYEKLIDEQGFKVQYVDALSRAYVAQGEVRKAAALIEEYNRRVPGRPDALRRLADIYLTSQQRGAYIATLEKMVALEPTPQALAELLEYYTLRGDVKNQTRITEKLYQEYPQLMAGPPVRLAKLMASQGALEGATNVLLKAYQQEEGPQGRANFTQADIMFLAGLLARTGNYEELRNLMAQTVKGHPKGEVNTPLAIQLSQLLSTNNEPEFALQQMLIAYEKTSDPRIEVEIVNLEVLLDQGRTVFDRQQQFMQSDAQQKTVNPDLITAFLNAALQRLDMPSIVRLTRINPADVLESTWLQIAEVAATNGTTTETEALLNNYALSQPAKNTVAAYALMLALPDKNPAATAKIMQLHQQEELSPQQRIGLARIFYFTSQPEASLKMVQPFNTKTIFADGDYLPLANVYLLNQQTALGLNLFGRIDATPYRKPSQFHVARLLLEVASQKTKPADVVAWLKAQPQGVYLDQLSRDLYFVAYNNQLFDLAYAVADFMYTSKPNVERAQMLMQSALRVGQGEAVMARIDKSYLDLPEFELIKLTLLARQAQSSRAAKGELQDLVRRIMNNPESTDVRKLDALDILIQNKQEQIALPYLRERALAEKTSTWLFAYLDAAGKTGNLGDVAQLIEQNYATLSLTEEEKNNFAFYFLENGQPEEARKLFKQIITEYGPQSAAAESLAYLWSVNPELTDKPWQYKQAMASREQQFTGWLQFMQSTQSYAEVSKAIAQRYGRNIPDNVLPYDFTAKAWQKEGGPQLRKDIQAYVNRQTDSEKLNTFGLGLVEANRVDLALIVFERMVELDPNNVDLRVTAAQAMLNRANYTGAAAMLKPVKDDAGLGWRGRVVYGLALNGRGYTQEAQPYLDNAAQSFPEGDKETVESGGLYAQVLFREGARHKALNHYEKLIEKHPDVLELQTDYAAMLLEDNQAAKAQKVLRRTGKLNTNKKNKAQ